MDKRLLEAAVSGDATEIIKQLALDDPGVLLGTTPRGNTCLHIASIHGHEGFCKDLLGLALNQSAVSLLAAINKDGETPLLTAVTRGRDTLASVLLRHCRDRQLNETILKQDKRGCNALHHAICRGSRALALELIEAEPALSKAVTKCCESPMYTAVMRNFRDVLEKLLEIPDAAHGGARGCNALHAAVTSGNAAMAKRIMVARPGLVRQENEDKRTPMHLAAIENKIDVLTEMRRLYLNVPGVLVGTTPQGNTCLHIAAIHGHEVFCKEAQALKPPLLAAVNSDGETPLLAAVAGGRVSVAYALLRCCRDQQLSGTIQKQDKTGSNVLHHAIRSGHRELALELIQAEPALSHAVNQYGESPMFIAVMRNCEDVVDKLLQIPDSAHGGAYGCNALHAAVKNGNSAVVKKIVEARPGLAREEDKSACTPMMLAVLWGKIDVVSVLLEHDRSLGYFVGTAENPLLGCAAFRGHVGVARELLKHCPDAPYCKPNGWTCLHEAVVQQHQDFVNFVLDSPQLHKLINMRARNLGGSTALHLAVQKCNPSMVAALLLHKDIDVTVHNNSGDPAIWKLSQATDHAKTLNWNEVFMLMLNADPQDALSSFNLQKEVKDKVTDLSRKDIKSLTQTYTQNTSLVAILIATITFAAAFTLPGGYSTDSGNEGLPIMSRKFAFKAFLISDALAMCSSLAVTFICVIAKWEDLEFLLYYRSFTKKLMWFAYTATTTAFATGLFTVVAPRLLWLAIVVCVLTSLLPILTKLLGEWPILKLRIRLGRSFKSELLDMV